MLSIVPAVIPESFEHLSQTLLNISSFTHEVQIDIVDGIFVSPPSWPYTTHASPSLLSACINEFNVEIDCMIHAPEVVLEEYLTLGVKRVVIHLESTANLEALIALKKKYHFKLGFSISNDTDIRVLTSVILYADYVQLMGIREIGSQSQPFDTRVLERIVTLVLAYPDLEISVDGSVNQETIGLLRNAGATRCVVGSAILHADDPASAYAMLGTL